MIANHFTAFLISGDGYFRVSDYRNGVWIDRVPWRAWPHIRRDGTRQCPARRMPTDETCTFFVNDEWTWQEPSLSRPHAGSAWWPTRRPQRIQCEVRFDQFAVRSTLNASNRFELDLTFNSGRGILGQCDSYRTANRRRPNEP